MTFDEVVTIAERKDVSMFQTNNQFMSYAIELYKEFFTFFSAILSIEELHATYLNRKDALIFGLLRKLEDLSINYLNIACNGSVDTASILVRTTKETVVTVLLMLDNYDDDTIFADYIKYSLITEKRFFTSLEEDDKNPDLQGELKLMRERMKNSVSSSFENAGILIDELDIKKEQKNNFWCKTNIYERFQRVQLPTLYNAYRLSCHSTHANWQNLNFYFLNHNEQGISINSEKVLVPPQLVLSYIFLFHILLGEVISKFIDSSDIRTKLLEQMNNCIDEVKKVEDEHEKFLVHNGNHTY